jgi:hypothetical protein
MTGEKAQRAPKPTLELVSHPFAPAFDGPEGRDLLQSLIEQFDSGAISEVNPSLRLLIAQAGFVNLWFFLKYIVGYSISPFEMADDDLHLDMCNFRQRFLIPGSRAAAFQPRFSWKSSIYTEGATLWEILRNPDIAILITNAIADKASEFFDTIKMCIESNPFFHFLYGNPEDPWGSFVPENVKNHPRWNANEIVVPNRSRWQREPTLTFGGVGGASEGGHFDLHVVDDMIGLKGLNATQESNAVMTKTRNWFWSSEKTLLRSMRSSRVFVVGTRYAVDDVYDDIIKRAASVEGYPIDNVVASENGQWHVYYRKVIEHGRIILPQQYTEEGLRELAENDWWTYVTQFLNDPQSSGLAELVDYPLKHCTLEYVGASNEWYVCLENGEDLRKIPLSTCDVVMAVDPAATERRLTAKTSRTAVGVIATDPQRRRFLIDLRADYVSVLTMFDWMFSLKKKFEGVVRQTLLESNAGFKVLGPMLRKEERERGEILHLTSFPAAGEKVARIRATLMPELEAGRLYVVDSYYHKVEEEKRGFPQAVHKMDILDMMSTGIAACMVPPDEEEQYAIREAEDAFTRRTANVAGY